MNLAKLLVSRALRKDPYVPKNCYAHKYNIQKNEKCDCRIWCKYPPPGNAPALVQEHIVHNDSHDIYEQKYG